MVCRYSGDAGLQMAASGAHVPECTLRSGSRNPPLSPRPDL